MTSPRWPVLRRLREEFGPALRHSEERPGPLCVTVGAEDGRSVLEFLREETDLEFAVLCDLFGVDRSPGCPRFEVLYHLRSLRSGERITVRAQATDEEEPTFDSVTELWPAARWAEREAFDLFGIRFRGHSGLGRLLLPDHFAGHPLRRDFAVVRDPGAAPPPEVEAGREGAPTPNASAGERPS